MSDLPRVFKNEIHKDIGNNNTYSYDKNKEPNSQDRTSNLTVQEKIRNIFNSPNYVYKANVVVKYDGKKEEKQLIGHNKDYIITLDDEKIPISKIDDIYLK